MAGRRQEVARAGYREHCSEGSAAEEVPAGAETWKADPPTPHDLRRTFATRLSALSVTREDRLACLNHKDAGVHAKHYDKYERAKEKRAAMNIWANTLGAILDGDKGTNVVPMLRK